MFGRRRAKDKSDSLAMADETELRLLRKQQEVERRDPEVQDVVSKLKEQYRRNHFGEALVVSFGTNKTIRDM